MKAQTLLDKLRRKGVRFDIENGILWSRDLAGRQTKAEFAAVHKHAAEFVAIMLKERADWIAASPTVVEFSTYKRRAGHHATDQHQPGAA